MYKSFAMKVFHSWILKLTFYKAEFRLAEVIFKEYWDKPETAGILPIPGSVPELDTDVLLV